MKNWILLTLHVDTTDAMVWIVGSDIVGTRSSTDIILLSRISCVPKVYKLCSQMLVKYYYMELQ
jgi:hypothetical protein